MTWHPRHPARRLFQTLSLGVALAATTAFSPALADTPLPYREVADAQALWHTVSPKLDLIDARFLLKSGSGFGPRATYWLNVGGQRQEIAVDGFGRFDMPALSADQSASASFESDSQAGPIRLETDIVIRAEGLPFEYRRLSRAAAQVDTLVSALIDKAVGGAAFLVKGFIPSTRNLDVSFEPAQETCALVLTYKDGDQSRIETKGAAPARLALKPVYARENPQVSATCPIRAIRPATDKPKQDAPKFEDIWKREVKCREIEAKFDLYACASAVQFKGPNLPKGQVVVEEMGVETDITEDAGAVELWLEHNGERVAIPITPSGQVFPPDRPDLLAANPVIQSNLDAAYLKPVTQVAPVKPPVDMSETLIQSYLSQLDGIVRVVVGPGLATVVPSFDTVKVMMIPGVNACEMIAKAQDREIARETPPPDKGIRLKPPFDKANGVDQVQFTCPIRSFDIISTTWLGDIQVKDKGFRLRRRDALPG